MTVTTEENQERPKVADPQMKNAWKFLQIGFLTFPILPAIGAWFIGLATVLTWLKRGKLIIRQKVNRAWGVIAIFLIITTIFAKNKGEALLGLGNFLPFFIVFAGISQIIRTPNQLKRLSWVLVLASVPVLILGLGQLWFDWSGPGAMNFFWQLILGWDLDEAGNPDGRMASVFMYANTLGIYLLIIWVLSLALLIDARRQRQAEIETQLVLPPASDQSELDPEIASTPSTDPRLVMRYVPPPKPKTPLSKTPIPFLTVMVILQGIAIMLTNSRSAWGLSILAALAYAVYFGRKYLVGLLSIFVATVFAAAFAPKPIRKALGLRVIVPDYFWTRLTDQNFADRPEALLRTTQWKFAEKMTWKRPFTGWGLRNFTSQYEAKMNIWLGHPHNLFLMLSSETGIITAVAFFVLVAWILIQGVLLFINWFAYSNCQQNDLGEQSNRLIFFSYLLAFVVCVLFNMTDVSIFDFRVNTLGWLLLSAITGNIMMFQQRLNQTKGKFALG